MLTLRSYQREAVDALFQYFAEKDGNPLCVIPTAGGKSLILSVFIREAIEKYSDTRILVVTHVKELIAQNYQEFVKLWPGAPAGIYSAGLGKRDIRAQVLFCGIQSIWDRSYSVQKCDILIIDEAHLLPPSDGTLYKKFIETLKKINPHLKVIGLTATPFRMGTGMLHEGKDRFFTEIAYEAKLKPLIADGFLCPPVSVEANFQIDTDGVKTSGGEFIATQLEARVRDPETIDAIADEICFHGADRRGWIVFGCGVDHCSAMRDAIRSRQFSAESIFGNTPSGERASIINRFKRQEIRCLVSMNVLTTGFNAPHVDLIGIARPTKSPGLYVQIVGRGTRLYPGKIDCKFLDFGGNIARHGPVDDPFIKTKRDGVGEAPIKKCPVCGEINPAAARVCIECGAEFEIEGSKVDTKPSSLSILSNSVPEWVAVDDVQYGLHEKHGAPPSLRVIYTCGMQTYSEWVHFERQGMLRQKAVSWWQRRSAQPAPINVSQALERAESLLKPKEIAVRKAGKFWEVMGANL